MMTLPQKYNPAVRSRVQGSEGGLLRVMHSSDTTPSNTTLIVVLERITDESVVLLAKVKE
jgi:hypothetical protein